MQFNKEDQSRDNNLHCTKIVANYCAKNSIGRAGGPAGSSEVAYLLNDYKKSFGSWNATNLSKTKTR